MLIPGALFGYFAGYAYWFPKVFGFKLDETWGKRAFWLWIVGFYLAFMPLYALGFMGMPRRLLHYDNAHWQPYLVVALSGTLIIFGGILCQILQLTFSIRNRAQLRDETGDPWDGRTLEWSVPSPPPAYNFARIPRIHTRDAFLAMKNQARDTEEVDYEAILLPRSSSLGPLMGGLTFVLGFSLVWYLWWSAILALAGLLGCVIARSWDEHTEEELPASAVRAIETALRHPGASAAGTEEHPSLQKFAFERPPLP